ncbi:MAG: hypothetical protein LBJ38_03310 [Oscillospiraceae bacterium]|nr:hypothetical protein [Oscillospiraceae bacterium]
MRISKAKKLAAAFVLLFGMGASCNQAKANPKNYANELVCFPTTIYPKRLLDGLVLGAPLQTTEIDGHSVGVVQLPAGCWWYFVLGRRSKSDLAGDHIYCPQSSQRCPGDIKSGERLGWRIQTQPTVVSCAPGFDASTAGSFRPFATEICAPENHTRDMVLNFQAKDGVTEPLTLRIVWQEAPITDEQTNRLGLGNPVGCQTGDVISSCSLPTMTPREPDQPRRYTGTAHAEHSLPFCAEKSNQD